MVRIRIIQRAKQMAGTVTAALARKAIPYVAPFVKQKLQTLLANARGRIAQRASAGTAIKGTQLASYLDRRYARKCGVEIKQTDLATNPSITTSLATYYSPFTGVAQGTSDSTRIGDSIEVKECAIRATFTCGATSTGPTTVRIMVCKQNQMQAAALTGSAVLQDPTNIRSPKLLDQQRSFTILKDFTFKLSGFNSGDTSMVHHWNWTYRPKGCHHIKWTQADSTGAIGNMLEGNLQILIMYEQAGAASGPTSVVYFRTQWLDV